jgi:hypothetical protein
MSGRDFTRVVFALAVLLGVAFATGCGPERTSFLFRHFELEEARGPMPGPADFDDFTVTHFGKVEPRVDSLLSAGHGCYRYVNLLHCQPEAVTGEYSGPEAPWFEYLGQTIMLEWGAFLVNADGDTARFKYYGGDDYIIDWGVLGEGQCEEIAKKLLELSGPGCSLFLDQVWPSGLSGWMFAELQVWYSMTPEHRAKWAVGLNRFLRVIRSDRFFGPDVITNGAWTAAPPIYIENAEQSPLGSFDDALEVWRKDPRNVLSVRTNVEAWVDSAIVHWLMEGGRLAFSPATSPRASVTWAYERASRARFLVEGRP